MSRQRLRAIQRRINKIGQRPDSTLTSAHLVRDIIELDALRDEMDSIMFQILESKSVRSPAEAALHAYLSKKARR